MRGACCRLEARRQLSAPQTAAGYRNPTKAKTVEMEPQASLLIVDKNVEPVPCKQRILLRRGSKAAHRRDHNSEVRTQGLSGRSGPRQETGVGEGIRTLDSRSHSPEFYH